MCQSDEKAEKKRKTEDSHSIVIIMSILYKVLHIIMKDIALWKIIFSKVEIHKKKTTSCTQCPLGSAAGRIGTFLLCKMGLFILPPFHTLY